MTIIVLLILFIGAGILYTYLNGDSKVVSSPPKVIQTKIAKPPASNPNALVGVAVQYISTPVKPGEAATMTIHTNGQANCRITVAYKDGPISDGGLATQRADEYGLATWSWTVPSATVDGNYPVQVWCSDQKDTGYVAGHMDVSKTATTTTANTPGL